MIERRRGFSTENRAEAAIEIVEAKRHHCGQMARRMRQSQGCAIARMGIDAHRELVRVFERSPFRRSVFQDGELVAMGGLSARRSLRTAAYGWRSAKILQRTIRLR